MSGIPQQVNEITNSNEWGYDLHGFKNRCFKADEVFPFILAERVPSFACAAHCTPTHLWRGYKDSWSAIKCRHRQRSDISEKSNIHFVLAARLNWAVESGKPLSQNYVLTFSMPFWHITWIALSHILIYWRLGMADSFDRYRNGKAAWTQRPKLWNTCNSCYRVCVVPLGLMSDEIALTVNITNLLRTCNYEELIPREKLRNRAKVLCFPFFFLSPLPSNIAPAGC